MPPTTKFIIVSLVLIVLLSAAALQPRSAFGQQTCAPPPQGLVSWWPGDGNPNDIANRNHGISHNGVTYQVGKVAQAFNFDGTNSFVSIPHATNLDIKDIITIDAWINPAKGGVTIADKTENNDSANYRFFLGIAGEGQDSRIGFWNGANFVLSRGSIPFNQYSHVAMTLTPDPDLVSSFITFYINGVLDSTQRITGGLGRVNNGQLMIGADINGRHFKGQIDELEIYHRPLTQQEIKSIFDAGGVGKCKPNPRINGLNAHCDDFFLGILGQIIQFFGKNIPDPGWVYVDPNQKFRSAYGEVTDSLVSYTEFPPTHDSHDQVTDIKVDPSQLDILSDVAKTSDPNVPGGLKDVLSGEWETGTFHSETGKNAPERGFPKWAWPNTGDHVWMDGHWVFDCGEPVDVNIPTPGIPGGVIKAEHHFPTEIHPIRAIATMRDQMHILPSTGTTPVRVTATDLFIHGRAGPVVAILACGPEIINPPENFPFGPGTDSCPTQTTPINVNFQFDIKPLPPKPSANAILATFVENGPGNTVTIAPILEPRMDSDTPFVHVTVPLANSGVKPDDVYARKIYVGWVYPSEGLRHFKLNLNKMVLHDVQAFAGTCECSFFWMSVNRAGQNEWIRLVDYTNDNMDSFDGCPNADDPVNCSINHPGGVADFSGALFDYYVADGYNNQVEFPDRHNKVNIKAHGYDQDCLDNMYGDHIFKLASLAQCYIVPGDPNRGDNEDYSTLHYTLGPDNNYGIDKEQDSFAPVVGDLVRGQYELVFTNHEIPITREDTSDLQLSTHKTCTSEGERPFICTILVHNAGPGLPRNVVVRDIISTNLNPHDLSLTMPSFVLSNGLTRTTTACIITTLNQFNCNLGTIPVNGNAVITFRINSNTIASFDNNAQVSTDSHDPRPSNNQAREKISINIVNHPPIINMGPDQVIKENTPDEGPDVQLDGTKSSDPDGDTLSFTWKQIGGDQVVLDNLNSPRPSFSSPGFPAVKFDDTSTKEVLIFELTVDDGHGGTNTAIVHITLIPTHCNQDEGGVNGECQKIVG